MRKLALIGVFAVLAMASTVEAQSLEGITGNNVTIINPDGSLTILAPVPTDGVTDDTGGQWVTINPDSDGNIVIDDIAFTVTAIPEPSSAALLLTGILGIGAVARRRRSKR